ncbi:DUF6442 family protein [Clostridium sp. B9]|uniref:DUF6442 family protein n=1 Tax=Clostridium sp. B9 TaxID=3423224 RepID=UPI003D2F2076
MDKNSILEKSRKSRKDEGIEYVEEKGRKIGYIIFCFIFLFIGIFNLLYSNGSNEVFYATSSMFWVFIATDSFQKFKFTDKKVDLVTTIFASIATVGFLVNFIICTLK